MRFQWVEMQNFLAFGPPQRVPLDRQGLMAVFGQNRDAAGADSNGAAKSSILEAIYWALFGKTLRGLKGDEVIHRRVGKDCIVKVGIEDDAGDAWEVTRFRGVKSKRANDVSLLCNGNPPPALGGINLDVQEQIITLLGMDEQTFVQSVLMSYGSKPFSELTDGPQKLVLESILRIDQYARGRDVVNKRIKQRQNDLASVNGEMQGLVGQVAGARARAMSLAQQSRQHNTLVQQRRMELLKKKAACQAKIEEQYHSTGLDKLLDDARELEAQRNNAQVEYEKIGQKILVATRQFGAKRNDIVAARSMLHAQQEQYDQWCTTVNELAGKACPTCRRDYDPEQADAELTVADDQIKIIEEKVNVLNDTFNRLAEVEDKIIDELKDAGEGFRQQSVTFETQWRHVNQLIQQRSAALNMIVQLEQQAFNIEEEIARLDTDNPYEKLAQDAVTDLQRLQQKEKSLQFKQRALDIEIQHLLYWDRGFGNQGIKSYVIEAAIPFLNERVQHYADIMSGGDMRIQFQPGRMQSNGKWVDEFQVVVENAQGAEVYKGNSDGEKRRVNLCVGWALGDLAAARAKKSIRFKGLDEPFENLDETGEDLVMRFLNTVSSDYDTIMCITHSDHLRNQFPKALTVVKEGGFSRVE